MFGHPNGHDPYAVKVTQSAEIVGHLPKKISSICSSFLRRDGSITCTVTGSHQYSRYLIQGGLEIPCILTFEADECVIEKVKQLLLFVDKLSDPKPKPVELTDPKPPKRIRLEEDSPGQDSEVTETVWLALKGCNIMLSLTDKGVIENGKQLNDKHINFAQALLTTQYATVEGLKSTLYQWRFKLDCTKRLVQILHTRGNHWIVISNVECGTGKISVYDTLYSDIDDTTKKLIHSATNSKLDIVLESVQKQEGGQDCGVFAIAICTSLLGGYTMKFSQALLRPHLILVLWT